MPFSCKSLLTGLLIVLLLSVTAVGIHAATHAQGELQSCEFCSGHGDPVQGAPAQAAPALAAAGVVGVATYRCRSVANSTTVAPRPRAPPIPA